MKKIVTLLLIVFAAITTFAGNTEVPNQKDQSTFKMAKNDVEGECTISTSHTLHEFDCLGNPLTITYACTETRSTCAAAYSAAAGCAYSGAYLGYLAIVEGCW